jgi:hypothetical protein
MKSKLYFFLIMFSTWCLINILATLILRVANDGDYYFSSFHLVNFYVAFIMSVVAAISIRWFHGVISVIVIFTACCLIPGLIQGDLTGEHGFIPIEAINNGLFVHNELLLVGAMDLFFPRMSLNAAICLSDIFIVLFSGYFVVMIQELAEVLFERWFSDEYEELMH